MTHPNIHPPLHSPSNQTTDQPSQAQHLSRPQNSPTRLTHPLARQRQIATEYLLGHAGERDRRIPGIEAGGKDDMAIELATGQAALGGEAAVEGAEFVVEGVDCVWVR